jgi:DNA polymerase III epsilon subunit-like protein
MDKYNETVIVWDVETEGLNLRYSRPWELSWIEAIGDNIVAERQRFIDIPNLKVSDEVRRITHFDDEKYHRLKRPAAEVAEEFAEVLYADNVIVGQNLLGFDVYIWGVLCDMVGRQKDHSYLDRIIDNRFVGMGYREGIEMPGKNRLSWQYKIFNDRSLKSKVSQLALLKLFGIEYDPYRLHEGLYDCQKTFEIFKELRVHMKF